MSQEDQRYYDTNTGCLMCPTPITRGAVHCPHIPHIQDSETQKLLEKVLKVQFAGVVAERSNLIMRKQIVPLLKTETEK